MWHWHSVSLNSKYNGMITYHWFITPFLSLITPFLSMITPFLSILWTLLKIVVVVSVHFGSKHDHSSLSKDSILNWLSEACHAKHQFRGGKNNPNKFSDTLMLRPVALSWLLRFLSNPGFVRKLGGIEKIKSWTFSTVKLTYLSIAYCFSAMPQIFCAKYFPTRVVCVLSELSWTPNTV